MPQVYIPRPRGADKRHGHDIMGIATKKVRLVPPNLLPPMSPAPRPAATQIAGGTTSLGKGTTLGAIQVGPPLPTKQVKVVTDPGLLAALNAANPWGGFLGRIGGAAGQAQPAAGGPAGGQVTSIEPPPDQFGNPDPTGNSGPGVPVTKAQVRTFYVHYYNNLAHMGPIAQGHGAT